MAIHWINYLDHSLLRGTYRPQDYKVARKLTLHINDDWAIQRLVKASELHSDEFEPRCLRRVAKFGERIPLIGMRQEGIEQHHVYGTPLKTQDCVDCHKATADGTIPM